MKKPFSPPEFKAIYSKVPRLCVDLVIEMDGGVVLIERALKSWHGQWHLPGGTLYLDEKITDAAKRLAKEETGLIIEPKNLLGYIEFHSEKKERGFGYTVTLVMACSVVGGTIHLNDEGYDLKVFKVIPQKTILEHKEFLQSIGFAIA
jgi:ADP-ribose pyrophosphatase YjhB (NUDIX family)